MRQKIVLSLMLGFMMPLLQACGGPTEVKHTGGMEQSMKIGVDSALVKSISSVFDWILGRKPTTREVQHYAAMSAAPGWEQVLRDDLLASPEAREKIDGVLKDAIGFSNEFLIDSSLQLLADGHSLSDVAIQVRKQFSL